MTTLTNEINITKKTKSGRTELHTAARFGRLQIVTSLLKSGCNPNKLDSYGETPLHLAVRHNHKIVAQTL